MGVVTGVFQFANGSPVANASFQWKLSGDAVLFSGTAACVAPPVISGTLDANGNMTSTFAFNDVLSTTAGASTTYQLSVKARNGGQVWNETYYLTGTAANLNIIPPGGSPQVTVTATAATGSGGLVFTTAGNPGFFSMGLTGNALTWLCGVNAGSGGSTGSNNGQVNVVQFTLQNTWAIRSITAVRDGQMLTASAHRSSVGIYSSDGNTKLVDSGVFTVLSSSAIYTVMTNTIAAVTLTPGAYLFASTSEFKIGSGLPTWVVAPSGVSSNFPMLPTNVTAPRLGIAANTSTAGALPSTIGVITTYSAASATAAFISAYFEP